MDLLFNKYLDTVIKANHILLATNKIKKLVYHAGRCKNKGDREKLIAMVVIESIYLKNLIKNT